MMDNENTIDNSAQDQSKKSRRLSKSIKNSFSIVGHNGAPLVEPVLLSLGWQKINEKNPDDFKLRWTELLSHINYSRFKEGEQMVNHIPNCGLITNKLGLLTSLRSYDKSLSDMNKTRSVEFSDFTPETYIIDDIKEREKFFETFQEGDIWINKPTGLNQGKGITLIRDIDEFKKELDSRDSVSRSTMSGVKARIVQRYIKNPLLLEGRKFDIRSYMFIASTSPYLVMYCPGYIRLSMNPYSNEDTDLITHLTNQYIQKKSPNYGDVKEDTIWSMAKFNDYVNDNYRHLPGFKLDWGLVALEKQIQQIMLHVFNSVKYKFSTRVGFFEIYGFDFMVDTDLKTWLIEVNVNPALHIHCAILKELLPPMIEEVILIALECFEKSVKSKKSLIPLECQRIFTIIYAEGTAACRGRISAFTSLKSWIPPRYRSTSLSPNCSRNEEKSPADTSTALTLSSKPSNGRNNGATNVVTVSREIKFENSLRYYQRVKLMKENDNNSKSDRIPNSALVRSHERSKSFNPIPSETKDTRNRLSSNYDKNRNSVILEKSVVERRKESAYLSGRNSTSINFSSLTLDPTRMKADLFNPPRTNTQMRKSLPIRVREPAPISLVQVVTGKQTVEKQDMNNSRKTNKPLIGGGVVVMTPRKQKIYDRSS